MAESGALRVVVDDGDVETIHVDPETGTITEHQSDGGVMVRLDVKAGLGPKEDEDWFKNLIDDLDGTKLSVLINDLIDGIKADDQSRQGWLANTTRGLDLMGLQIEDPSADVQSTGDGPVMSKVKNPMLLEACLKGWANAEAELLPANGPVKIKSDGQETKNEDNQAELLERAFNRYLTTTATEYYPETSHMLLWGTYFRGSGFKKIYRCPRRRRPVSEMVEAKDLIVSNTSKDLRSCGRITHEIEMRPSVFKLMQMIGAYRKTGMTQPNPTANSVDEKIASIQGTEATPSRPEDKPYTIWETQCELDLDEFIPEKSKFKGQGIPLPYLVSIDKDNEEGLSIRRDWQEDDEWCARIRMYVRYPYVPGPGFYGTGMLNILGNASAAMTAAWREALDAGMFASFPGGFIDKKAVRGNNNTTFTQGPGEFSPIEIPPNSNINNVVAPMPYKDVTPGLLQLIDKITQQSKSVAQSAEVPVSEGVQNVPVGTIMAAIEQATKVMAAAHKGMHNAQSEEIQMLVDLFRHHPDDLLKSDGDSPLDGWTDQQLIQALQNNKLVPVSDPNVPSHVHRIAKAVGLIQVYQIPEFKSKMDGDEVLRRVLSAMKEDITGLLLPPQPPQQMPPNPADLGKLVDAQAKMKKVDNDIATDRAEMALKSKEMDTERATHEADIAKEALIHGSDQEKIQADRVKDMADLALKGHQLAQDDKDSRRKTGLEMVKAGLGAHDAAQKHSLGVASHVETAKKNANDAVMQTQQALKPKGKE